MKKLLLLFILYVGIIFPQEYFTKNLSKLQVVSGNITTTNYKHNIYTIGHSMVQSGLLQTRISILLGRNWNLINCGVSGSQTALTLARFDSCITNSGQSVEYVIIWDGVNDISAGVSTSSICANLQSMYNKAKSLGAKVIAITITPCKTFSGWTTAKSDSQTIVNNWILNTAANVDYKINGYTILNDPGNLGALLSAYDSGDHLHPSTTGYDTLGANVYRSVIWTMTAKDSTTGNINIPYGSFYCYNGAPIIAANTDLDNYFFGRIGITRQYDTQNNPLLTLTTGNRNCGFGSYTLNNLASASWGNTAIGYNAGLSSGNGNNNIECYTSEFIGYQARPQLSGQLNQVVIGYNAIGYGSNTVTLGNTSTTETHLMGYIYLVGSATTAGSWRMSAAASGNCIIEYTANGTTWTAKQTLTP